MKEFITRTATAFVLIIVSFSLIKYVPPVAFAGILFLLIFVGATELERLTEPKITSRFLMLINGLIIAVTFALGKNTYTQDPHYGTSNNMGNTLPFLDMSLAVILVVMITGLFFLFSIRNNERLGSFVRDMGIQYLAAFYLFLPLFYLYRLKEMAPNYLFFLIFVIAIGDSAAYFIGRAIGKHKIYPVASPKKSLEGLIAAVVFAAASGWLSVRVFPVPVSGTIAIITGGITGLLSQLSDPIESLFKRAGNQKDSGTLFPGHGGILDRLDSYIFCAPALFYMILFFWK